MLWFGTATRFLTVQRAARPPTPPLLCRLCYSLQHTHPSAHMLLCIPACSLTCGFAVTARPANLNSIPSNWQASCILCTCPLICGAERCGAAARAAGAGHQPCRSCSTAAATTAAAAAAGRRLLPNAPQWEGMARSCCCLVQHLWLNVLPAAAQAADWAHGAFIVLMHAPANCVPVSFPCKQGEGRQRRKQPVRAPVPAPTAPTVQQQQQVSGS